MIRRSLNIWTCLKRWTGASLSLVRQHCVQYRLHLTLTPRQHYINMQTVSRTPRASVLGKRAHQVHTESTSTAPELIDLSFATLDPSPCAKRARTSLSLIDGEGNKENVPPLHDNIFGDSPAGGRALQRTNTEFTTPTRPRISCTVWLLLSIIQLCSYML